MLLGGLHPLKLLKVLIKLLLKLRNDCIVTLHIEALRALRRGDLSLRVLNERLNGGGRHFNKVWGGNKK